MTHIAYLHAMSFWSPVTSLEPETDWVSPRLLRGASRFTRMLLHTAERVVREGGADPKTVATIYGSQYGEIETMCIVVRMETQRQRVGTFIHKTPP